MSSLVEAAVLEPVDSAPAAPLPPLRRLSIGEYEKLVELEVIPADERVELLGGILYTMSPINAPHASCVSTLGVLLVMCVGRAAVVRTQAPITLDDQPSQPQPDVVVAAPQARNYYRRHPRAGEVQLVIEVSDSSLQYDRTVKAEAYAAAGIPDYLIMNLVDRRIEVYRDPITGPDGRALYRTRRIVMPGESVALLRFPQCVIEVDAVMPPEEPEGDADKRG